jgi:predicted Fe-Mo cluster-binding NifX family protein
MKIAISSIGKDLDSDVDGRFGRCNYFLIVELENKKIKNFNAIENTGKDQAGGAAGQTGCVLPVRAHLGGQLQHQ